MAQRNINTLKYLLVYIQVLETWAMNANLIFPTTFSVLMIMTALCGCVERKREKNQCYLCCFLGQVHFSFPSFHAPVHFENVFINTMDISIMKKFMLNETLSSFFY
jgi:hypothetical protein